MGVDRQLPPKREVALALLEASMVAVYLDPRGEDVHVPPWFKKQPQLMLQIGLNMPVPIPDLDVGDDALSCTLSFNRRPEFCRIPWNSIYALVGEDGRGMVWPDDVPPEVAGQAQGRASAPKAGSHLRAVPSAAEGDAAEGDAAERAATEQAAAKDAGEEKVGVSPAAKKTSAKGNAAEKRKKKAAERAGKKPSAVPDRSASANGVSQAGQRQGGEHQRGERQAGERKGKRELPSYLRVVK